MSVTSVGSRIEGIGRPHVEPSFIPAVVDHMVMVSDPESIAAMQLTSLKIGKRVGGSTGTNVWAALKLASHMYTNGIQGSIVSLICDSGERYLDTYYSPAWLAAEGIDPSSSRTVLADFLKVGRWDE